MQTSVSMIPLTDWKRWIWPSNWPHRWPSKYSEIHFSIWNKTQGHTDQEQNQQTHTLHSCAACSVPGFLPNPSTPAPAIPHPETNKHACKQTGRQANRACTHKLCLSGARHDWKCPCGSVTRETQPRQTRRQVARAWAGAPVNWSHILLKRQRVKCRSYATDATRSSS